MVEPSNPDLSIGKQCKLLSISRSSFYYTPKGETAMSLALMRQIDEQFLETPFFGVRQMTWHLRNEGHLVNEKRIRRLMRLMGLMPIHQKPNTSKAAKRHKTYSYVLRGLKVTQPNQVWGECISAIGPRTMDERHHLPARLGNRIRDEGRCRKIERVLQPQANPSRPWRPPSRDLLADERRNQTRSEGAA